MEELTLQLPRGIMRRLRAIVANRTEPLELIAALVLIDGLQNVERQRESS